MYAKISIEEKLLHLFCVVSYSYFLPSIELETIKHDNMKCPKRPLCVQSKKERERPCVYVTIKVFNQLSLNNSKDNDKNHPPRICIFHLTPIRYKIVSIYLSIIYRCFPCGQTHRFTLEWVLIVIVTLIIIGIYFLETSLLPDKQNTSLRVFQCTNSSLSFGQKIKKKLITLFSMPVFPLLFSLLTLRLGVFSPLFASPSDRQREGGEKL